MVFLCCGTPICKKLKIATMFNAPCGYFQPVVDPSLYEGVDSLVSQEELNRRSKKGGGRPIAEILADLEEQA